MPHQIDTTGRRLAVIGIALIGLATGCHDGTSPDAVANAAIRVSASTTGSDLDDGYTVTVGGGAIGAFRIGANGSATLDSLWPVSYAVWLDDIADNCTVAGPNPQRVIAVPATAAVDFAVTCVAKGTVQITNVTTGSPPDPDGYVVELERNSSTTSTVVPPGGTASVVVTPGIYTVSVSAVAANCTVTVQPGGFTRQVEVVSGATITIAFAVSCAPVPTPDVAFVRDGRIYRMNPDGAGVVRLSDGPGDADPAWSPDGQRIAFARGVGEDSWGTGTHGIHIMDADGSNVVRLTNAGRQPAWSPDGRTIAFAGQCDDGQGCILVANVDAGGTNLVRLGFKAGFHDSPAWSPDGSRIAFTSDVRAYDFLFDLYVMNADGSGIQPLLEGPFFANDGVFYFQPAWSPDGRRIAVVVCGWAWAFCYPNSSVAVANADGSGLTTLAAAGGYARPTWSPSGDEIAFSSASCPTCRSDIYVVRANGSDRRLLVTDGHSPSWRW